MADIKSIGAAVGGSAAAAAQEPHLEEESITKPGDVSVDVLDLFTSSGQTFNLKGFMIDLQLTEDIWTPAIYGNVTITDANNMINLGPIRGGEILHLKLRTKTMEDVPVNIIEKSFQIYAIESRVLNNDREAFYDLKFTSIEAISDQQRSLTQAYGHDSSTTTDQIAEKIWLDHCQEFRRIDEKNAVSNLIIGDTPHKSRVQYTSNHWTPFQNLQFLSRKAVGAKHKGSDFIFFEGNKNFYFTSIQNLIQAQLDTGLFEHYVYEQAGQDMMHRNTGDDFLGSPLPKMFSKIESITVPRTVDIIDGQDSGYYASSVRVYDMYSKEQAEYIIDARNNFKEFVHTEEGIPVPAGVQRNPYSYVNIKYLNMLTSAGMQGGLNTGAKGAAANVNVAESQLLRQNYFNSFKDNTFEVTVPGRTDIEVGYLIKLAYPITGDKPADAEYDDIVDPVLSGNFMISCIKHTINTEGHKMLMEIVKNGYAEGTGPEDDVVPMEDF